MKILHLETGRHLYGGARQVLLIMEGLQQQKVENLLVCDQTSPIAEAAKPFATVIPMTMAGDLDLGFIARARRIIRDRQPDLVHLHSRRGADWLGGIAARLEGVPAVLSRRVDNPESRLVTAVKYRLFESIIAISDGIGRVLARQGVPADKLTVVRSAVNFGEYQATPDRAAFQREFQVPENHLVIGVIAQLIGRKGHRYLIDCLPDILEKYPQIQVLFFGQGPLQESLEQKIQQLGLGHNVKLVGFRDDLAQWLGCLDLVVHPADMEGLGVSLLQAAAAGVAMVGSRVGGIPEIIKDGETGRLFEPGDTEALKEAVLDLVGDDQRRRRLGQAAQDYVRQRFSVDEMVKGNLSVYQNLLDSK